MKHRAAILSYDFNNPAPTASELKTYLGTSSKLLFGNDKRKSKNTPYVNRHHLITHSFNSFKHLYSPKDNYQYQMLYIFDDKVNSTHFFLKYASQVLAHFELDDKIIDEMHKVEWDYSHLQRYKGYVESTLDSLDFFVEKDIGGKSFHNAFPAHVNSTQKFISKIDKELEKLEKKANQLFQCGWSD